MGLIVIRGKVKSALIKVLPNAAIDVIGIIIFIPLILVIRLIQPLYSIQFGWVYFGRLGHFVYDLEYYLTEN